MWCTTTGAGVAVVAVEVVTGPIPLGAATGNGDNPVVVGPLGVPPLVGVHPAMRTATASRVIAHTPTDRDRVKRPGGDAALSARRRR